MTFTITFPSSLAEQQIDEMRNAIGRPIYWYIIDSTIPCSACSLEPVTNTSVNSFCPVCSGLYWIETLSGVMISGHVSWGRLDDLKWATAGQYFEGDCTVQIKYTAYNDSIVDSSIYVLVDGKVMDVNKKVYRGFQPLNRIIVDLKEKE